MNFDILIPPLIGGVIGYITNDIAIRMLFHPRKPLYIGSWQVPFSVGLIPKEKARVARSIGQVVSNQLLNRDTLADVLISEEITGKLRSGLEGMVEKNRFNEATLGAALKGLTSDETVDSVAADIKNTLTELICEELKTMKFGERISAHVLQKVKQSAESAVKGFGLGFSFLNDSMINSLAGNVGELIDKAVSEHSGEIVKDLMDSEADKLMNMKIGDIIAKYDAKISQGIDMIVRMYVHLIDQNIDRILGGIDLGKVVEDKIASFDVVQLEDMIFGIMKKELNAIVYLGALLGFMMGWVNVFLGV